MYSLVQPHNQPEIFSLWFFHLASSIASPCFKLLFSHNAPTLQTHKQNIMQKVISWRGSYWYFRYKLVNLEYKSISVLLHFIIYLSLLFKKKYFIWNEAWSDPAQMIKWLQPIKHYLMKIISCYVHIYRYTYTYILVSECFSSAVSTIWV